MTDLRRDVSVKRDSPDIKVVLIVDILDIGNFNTPVIWYVGLTERCQIRES